MSSRAHNSEEAGLFQQVDLEMASLAAPTGIPAAPTTNKHDEDPFLVVFAQPFDSENPESWPSNWKWAVTNSLSASGFNRIHGLHHHGPGIDQHPVRTQHDGCRVDNDNVHLPSGAGAIYGLGGGVLGDIWRSEERGKGLRMYLTISILWSSRRAYRGWFSWPGKSLGR